MIRPCAGSIVKVNGSIRATPLTADRPGSAPMIVPAIVPISTTSRCDSCRLAWTAFRISAAIQVVRAGFRCRTGGVRPGTGSARLLGEVVGIDQRLHVPLHGVDRGLGLSRAAIGRRLAELVHLGTEVVV